ncbi:MAG: hypothetical protein Q4A64_05630 [Porphyromonadaceae bacterium]|nr:hypothetical protein [Porphyromonadaceae bacterium]
MKAILTRVFFAITMCALVAACSSAEHREKAAGDETIAGLSYSYDNFATSHVIAYQDSLLFFYNVEEDMTIPFHLSEPDEIFNFSFASDGKAMYYTVVREGSLWLRQATFVNGSSPKLEDLVNLKLTKEQCTLGTYGDRSRLEYSNGKVLIRSDFSWEVYDFSLFHIYDIARGNLRTASADIDEYNQFCGRQTEQEPKGFTTESGQLLYSDAGKVVCLTDQLDIRSEMEDEDEPVWYMGHSISPDRSKVAFIAITAFVDLAHGPLCIANADGSQQKRLAEDGATATMPARWVGNQLFFLDEDSELTPEHDADCTTSLFTTDASTNERMRMFARVRRFDIKQPAQ